MSRIFNLKTTIPKGNNTGYSYGTAFSNGGSTYITDSFTFFESSLLEGPLMPYMESLTNTIEDGGVEWIITMQLKMADNTPAEFRPPFVYYFPDTGYLYIAQFVEYIIGTTGGVAKFYRDIKSRIASLLDINGEPVFKFVHIWNNQVALENEETNRQFSYPKPAVFVEITTPAAINSLLGGFQAYDDLRVRLHIVSEVLDANGNGFMDENFTIFDLAQLLYSQMNKFEPPGAVAMMRTGEEQDYDHNNIYHFVQEYTTNLIDSSQSEPKGAINTTTPLTLELNLSFIPAPFIKGDN